MPRASPEVLREHRPTAGRRELYQRGVVPSDRAWQRVAHHLAQGVRVHYDCHNELRSRGLPTHMRHMGCRRIAAKGPCDRGRVLVFIVGSEPHEFCPFLHTFGCDM